MSVLLHAVDGFLQPDRQIRTQRRSGSRHEVMAVVDRHARGVRGIAFDDGDVRVVDVGDSERGGGREEGE